MNSSFLEESLSNVEETPLTTKDSIEMAFRMFLARVFYPCLLAWGIIGNSLCLRVLLSKKFSKNSTCQYLAVLAVIDILFIAMRSSRHVYRLYRDTTIFNISVTICRTLTFFSSALAHMASWILVIVSFDRYLIVTSRYRRHGSPARRVLLSTAILIGIVVLCNLYYFFILGKSMDFSETFTKGNLNIASRLPSYGVVSGMMRYENIKIFVCIPKSEFDIFFRTYIPIFDILLVAVIPLILICFTNAGIIIFTMRNNGRMLQNRKKAHRRHQRLTIMLLSVTLAFIGLTCPSVIFICLNKIIYSRRIAANGKENPGENAANTKSSQSNMQLIVDVCEALWYTKHAMNFILYTLSGEDFRRAFIELFTKCCQRRSICSRCLLINSNRERSQNLEIRTDFIHSTEDLNDENISKRSFNDEPIEPKHSLLLESTHFSSKTLNSQQCQRLFDSA